MSVAVNPDAAQRNPLGAHRPVDFLIALGTGMAVVALIHLDPERSPRDPDAIAYALGIGAAGLLLMRRHRPVATFASVFAVHGVYHVLGYPGAGPFPATLLTLFTLAEVGLRRYASGAAALVVLTSVFSQVTREGAGLFSPSVVMPAIFSAAAVLAGEAAHNRMRYLAEVKQRLRRAETEQRMEAERRVTEERLRIARELHDIMAHTIAVISVQASEAQDALDKHPHQARAALRTIRSASRDAMLELRAAVGVMRDSNEADASPMRPAPGLAELPELVRSTGGGDLRVELRLLGLQRQLPAAVELTVYRLVQESLTNVIRHAHASNATVTVGYEPSRVSVWVEDDGRGPVDAGGRGYGVMGMTERVAAIGGWLDAGARPEGGYRVHAVLPVGEPE